MRKIRSLFSRFLAWRSNNISLNSQLHYQGGFVGWMAAGAIGSALIGSNASQSAADTQAAAANNASAQQLQMFNTINNQQAPWRQSGQNALSSINSFMGFPTQSQTFDQAGYDKAMANYNTGLAGYNAQPQQTPFVGSADGSGALPWQQLGMQQGGQSGSAPVAPDKNAFYTTTTNAGDASAPGMHQFTTADLNSTLAPNYQFQLDQGLGAVKNMATSTGGLIGGNSLKGINDYAQNFAGNAYQQAFNNYSAQQTNIYNRLSNIAGLGQNANQTTANAGQNAASNSGNYLTSGAAASAAGTVGAANAINGGINNAMGWNYLNSIGNSGGSTGGGANAANGIATY